jgi:hypothetical protein
MIIAMGVLWRQAVLVALWVAIGVTPAWAAPVLLRAEPERALAPARGLLVKLHGSGFEAGDQVELMRADVPALRGHTARIRGAMANDSVSGQGAALSGPCYRRPRDRGGRKTFSEHGLNHLLSCGNRWGGCS